jgi:ribonuclease HI
MNVPAPHFLLVAQARVASGERVLAGRWRFELRTSDGQACLAAEDDEPETSAERLELLAIVRGLEALDEPSRVTLVSAGRSISRGLRHGLAQWRESDWQWERYGQLAPVKNGDLWQRIDRAMTFHTVEWRDAPPTSDDLSPLETGSVSEGHAEPPVRVIQHRGRRLRIDRAHGLTGQADSQRAKLTQRRGGAEAPRGKAKRGHGWKQQQGRLWLTRLLSSIRIADFVLRMWLSAARFAAR